MIITHRAAICNLFLSYPPSAYKSVPFSCSD
jgi:hypothetical protein